MDDVLALGSVSDYCKFLGLDAENCFAGMRWVCMNIRHVFQSATEADRHCQLSGINHLYNLIEQGRIVLAKQTYHFNC